MRLILAALLFALPLTASAADRIIGVGLMLKQVDHKVFVEQLVQGAPAARDGSIQAGDQIISVQPLEGSEPSWVPVEQLQLDEVVQLVRGDEGTRVGLTLGSEKGQYEVFLTREPIEIP